MNADFRPDRPRKRKARQQQFHVDADRGSSNSPGDNLQPKVVSYSYGMVYTSEFEHPINLIRLS